MTARVPMETPSPLMAELARLPVFFALGGKRAVVAGGNAAAAWKAELLSAAGAAVEVYAPEPDEEILQLVAAPPRGAINLHRRVWRPGDLAGAALAVGACESDEEAAQFAAAAREAGVPVNVIDKPAFCDFSFGAIVNRSPLVIGISTDGAAPVLAQAIRGMLEGFLSRRFADWTAAALRWRARVKESGLAFPGRRKFWQLFADRAVKNVSRSPDEADFDALLSETRSAAAAETGSVALVGAGPGDPDLLTLKAVRALQLADVILFDDLVSTGVLDFARREAKKMLVGKSGHAPSCKQDDINALMVKLARAGKRVVRLKGGDPMIFARAGEEIAACRDAGIPVEIVPGITAAQGAASALGITLTGRGQARRLQYITGHDRAGALPDDIDWRSLGDPGTTTAIYMPVKTLAALVERAITFGLAPDTPAAAIIAATRPQQHTIVAPVIELAGMLAHHVAEGPVLVIIGRVLEGLAVAKFPENATEMPRLVG
jgi:uroporphyrin-III C-methyltransferase/precorrin-2 dehydrogenase/sirohydrochlorin ferrochelatase